VRQEQQVKFAAFGGTCHVDGPTKVDSDVSRATIGSEAVSGFPVIWAQNIKTVTLIKIGGSFECVKQIADQAEKNPGFKVVMQAVDPATQL